MEQIKHVNVLDFAVILAYLVMLSGVGVYVHRFNRNADDYFKGGGKVPWWMSGISTFVSGFSAFMFVGAAGYTYKNGMGSVALFTCAAWGYVLGYFVYATRWKRARLSSPMGFLTRRYSQGTTYYYTLLSVIPAIMGLGLSLYIVCIFLATALGIMNLSLTIGMITLSGLEMCMVVTGIVMLIYSSAGGLWAVMITDVLQFVILLVVTVLIFPLAFLALGGEGGLAHAFDRLASQTPEGFLTLGNVGVHPSFYLAYLFNSFLGYNAAWHVGQRYYSVPTERDARKMAILCAALSLILPVLWIGPTMAARALFPDIASFWPQLSDPTEASFVTLALALLPNGLIGLAISAVLAATMTSVDTSLNYLSSILVRDVYIKLKNTFGSPVPNAKGQLRVARITALILGSLAIFTALIVQRTKGVFDFALMYYSWFAPSMLTPVMLGFVFTKTPSWSAIAACTTSLIVVLIGNTVIHVAPFQYEFNVFGGILVTSSVFFLSMLWPEKNPAARDRMASFTRDLQTNASDVSVVWDKNALHSYRIVGVLTIGVGIALLLMMLVPTNINVRILTLVMGVATLGMGVGMFWYFKRQLVVAEVKVQTEE